MSLLSYQCWLTQLGSSAIYVREVLKLNEKLWKYHHYITQKPRQLLPPIWVVGLKEPIVRMMDLHHLEPAISSFQK